MREVGYFEILNFEILNRGGSNPIKTGEGFLLGLGKKRIKLRKAELKMQIQYPYYGKNCIYFLSFWRHGRVVRRGTANPFSPVQIRVSPDQQNKKKTRNIFCFPDITRRSIAQQKQTVAICLIRSIRLGWGFAKRL